jgi:hypothetical protein
MHPYILDKKQYCGVMYNLKVENSRTENKMHKRQVEDQRRCKHSSEEENIYSYTEDVT